MTIIQIGKILVDRDVGGISVNGKPIRLTNSEFLVLERLIISQGRVATREMLLNDLYARRVHRPHPKILDVFVCKLRKKLADATGGEDYIEPVYGEGYTLTEGRRRP